MITVALYCTDVRSSLISKFFSELPDQPTYGTYFGNSYDHCKTNQLKNLLRLKALVCLKRCIHVFLHVLTIHPRKSSFFFVY